MTATPATDLVVRRLAAFTGLRPDLVEGRLGRADGKITDWGVGAPPEAFVETLLNHETYFFRHPEQWRLIADRVLPTWASEPRSGGRVAWCAGCASGEEAWSLVALAAAAGLAGDLRVVATDLSRTSIERAAAGLYRRDVSLGSFREMPDFVDTAFPDTPGALWSVPEDWRPSVAFRRHNLVDPPPLARADLVLCRNVLIYFDEAPAHAVLRGFAEVLVEGGHLVLGPAEVARPFACFERVESDGAVVFRRTGAPP